MGFADIYQPGHVALSFELFPPKTDAGMKSLLTHLEELAACGPAYITCTYGAGGSTRARTLEVLAAVRARYPEIPVASHLTCVGASVDDLRDYLRRAVEVGVSSIVALRGDPPKGDDTFQPAPDGLRYASELVALIRADQPQLGVAVAGYPETHLEAPSPEADLDNLKRKVETGGEVVITQMFYDNADFLRFRDRCDAIGIQAPIVPGMFPVTNLAQIKKITSLCGARLTPELVARLEAHENDPEGQFSAGTYYAARQVEELIAEGVPGVHFYVLNKARSTAFICRALALSAQPAPKPV